MLENVKSEFDDTFSEDVYNTLGATRTHNDFSKYLQFSDRQESIPTEELYDLMGENEKLKKRVQILTADIKRWKERLKMEGKVTNGQYFRTSTFYQY